MKSSLIAITIASLATLAVIVAGTQKRTLPFSTKAASSGTLTGNLEQVGCNDGMSGWVKYTDNESRTATVQILIDQQVVGTTEARLYREDVGSHGFTVSLKNYPSIYDGKMHYIQARVADGYQTLYLYDKDHKGKTLTCKAPSYIVGMLETVNCTNIIGWACDPTAPDDRTDIAMVIDSKSTQIGQASDYRPDIKSQCGNRDDHGFIIGTPLELKTGTAKNFTITSSLNGATTLLGSATLNCPNPNSTPKPTPAPKPIGLIESANCTTITGWTCDPNYPSTTAEISVIANGVNAGSAIANKQRTDLTALCNGTTLHGFSINTPSSIKNGTNQNILIASTLKGVVNFIDGNKTINCPQNAPALPTSSASSLLFNGTGQFATTQQTLPSLSTFTIESWVKRSKDTGRYETYFGNPNAAYNQVGFTLYIDGGSKDCSGASDQFAFYSKNGVSLCSGVTADTNSWHHIAVSRDASGTTRMFVDGTLRQTKTSSPALTSSTGKITLGRAGDFGGEYFPGNIDEVKIAKNAIYTANFTPQKNLFTDSNTLLWWKFNEKSGQTVADSSNNGYTLTLGFNNTVEPNQDPTWSTLVP